MDSIFHVRIYLYTMEEGGRSTPPYSGYRPTIFFGLESKIPNSSKRLLSRSEQMNSVNTEGVIYHHDKELLLGESFECFLCCGDNIEVEDNSNFLITELIHVMGYGTVLKLVEALPPDLNFPKKPKMDGAAMNRYLKKKYGATE